MPTINSVNVKITGDESGLKKASKEAQSDIGKVGSAALSVGKLALGNALGFALMNVVGKAIGAVTREMDGAISRLDTINNYSKVMGNLGIGADDSAKSIDYLQEHLLGLPTALDDAALAVQRFTATNGNIKASTVGYLALNNAILAGGASMETQKTAMEQLTQAYSKGKPDAMEWRSMLTAMPAQMNQIAKAAGYSSAVIGGDFYNAIQDGKFSMNDFMATAIKLNTQGVAGFASFEEQARNATGGVQTSVANLKNAIQRGIATVLDTIGQANIAGFINGIAAAIGTVANYIAAFVKLIKEAVAWLGVLFGFKVGGGGKTADATKSTATNLAAADKSAGGVASGLNNAAGAAKKLNNQLASFDEMNVLRETTSGGGGAGGGGGAVGAGAFAVPEIDWGLDDAKKKENKIEKIFNKLKKFFSNFAKALKPIITVIADIWKSYLQPFLEWAGTTLLPAVFNAISGAVQFLGEVIASVWGKLKPFIDNFLVPIAQWTGGVIVGVLNAIGDALSWIAQQSTIVGFISDAAIAIGVVTAAIFAFNAAATIMNGLLGAMGAEMLVIPGIATSTAAGMAGITAGATIFEGVATAATAAVGALGAGLEFLISGFGGLIAPITGAVAIFNVFRAANEVAEQMALRYVSVQDQIKAATERANYAAQQQIATTKELSNAQLDASNDELMLLNLTKQATDARNKYEKMLKSGKFSQEELTKAELEAEVAEGRVQAQIDKLKESVGKVTSAQQTLHDEKMREVSATEEARLKQMAMEGQYDKVYKALTDLTHGTHEFKLQSGESFRLTAEESKAMAANILDSLDRQDTGMKGWLDEMKKTAGDIRAQFTKIRENAVNAMAASEDSGKWFDKGVANGIIRNKSVVENAARELARAGKGSFDMVLRINSPSKVMEKDGGWFTAGVAIGIKEQTGTVIKNVEALGNSMVKAFDATAQLPELSVQDATSRLDSIAGKAQARLDINAEHTAGAIESLANAIIAMQEDKQPIIVKVGEETLVDTMIEGINNASTMRNRGVINI